MAAAAIIIFVMPTMDSKPLASLRHRLRPGARVRVTQQIPARHYAWGTAHEGIIVKYAQKQTGSWFAHSRDDKLWLDRLVIRKDDGEGYTFNLDEYTHIDILADAPPAPPTGTDAPDEQATVSANEVTAVETGAV